MAMNANLRAETPRSNVTKRDIRCGVCRGSHPPSAHTDHHVALQLVGKHAAARRWHHARRWFAVAQAILRGRWRTQEAA